MVVQYGGVTHGTMPTWKAQPCFAYSRSVTQLVWRSASRPVRPVAPLDPASGSRTGGALRRMGGSAGLVLVYEAFQGGCPIWRCDPHAVFT